MKNNPELKSDLIDTKKQKDIKIALRQSFINHCDINIKVSGTAATLSGKTISLHQKEEAENIVAKTPGIWHVNNELKLNF
ncbi:BON domain-containing protein [Psychroserpens mesophilus]|uniref:BON domain-containing protein n=1 Tax=Psychroserpens mesophilus TaxID=325473 RepID=UPI000693AB1E|nr:BON domain-containing protein [Psychroserpens mesophilus]